MTKIASLAFSDIFRFCRDICKGTWDYSKVERDLVTLLMPVYGDYLSYNSHEIRLTFPKTLIVVDRDGIRCEERI